MMLEPSKCREILPSWWQWHPPVGMFISLLAILGVLVPWFRGEASRREKAFWTFAMFLFVGLEIRTLYLDRSQHDREQALARCQQLESFTAIANGIQSSIDGSKTQFNTTMKTNQQYFDKTISRIVTVERSDFTHFGEVLSAQGKLLSEQDRLLSHQQEVAESLKEQLIPGSDPFPISYSCSGQLHSDDFVVFVGTSAYISNYFPHVILRVGADDVIEIVKTSPYLTPVLLMDVRSKDNRIIARLGMNNIVVNPNNMLQVIRSDDKSQLIIEDQEGNRVLDARFYNPHVFAITGTMYYKGEEIPLVPQFTNNCTHRDGPGADISR
jgi:hypothetical protein